MRKAIGVLMLAAYLAALGGVKAQPSVNGNVASIQVANNTTAIVIKPAAGYVIGVEGFTISTSVAWVKIYDATAVTCGTGTPKARYFIPGSANGGGFVAARIPPDLFTAGIVVCITTGIADNDTTAPAASTFVVNVHWQ